MTLTLKSAHQSFCMTLWLMMMHQYTKSGLKRFTGSDDICQTNIHRHFEPPLWPWPWTQQSNFLTRYSSLWWQTIKLSLVAKRSAVQKIQQKQSYSDHTSLYHDLEVSTPIFVHDTHAHGDASKQQNCSQKAQWFRIYSLNKHSLTFWTFAVTLTLNTAIQFSHKRLQLILPSN